MRTSSTVHAGNSKRTLQNIINLSIIYLNSQFTYVLHKVDIEQIQWLTRQLFPRNNKA